MKLSPAATDPTDPRRPLRVTSARGAPTSLRLRCVHVDHDDASRIEPAPVDGLPEPRRHVEEAPNDAGGLVGRLATALVRLPLAVPIGVVGVGRGAWDWAAKAVGVGVDLPWRAADLVAEVTRLVAVVGEILDDARRIVDEVDDVLEDVRGSVAGVNAVTLGAERVSRAAGSTGRTVDELIALYEPLAREAAPLAQHFVDELSSGEVDAAIKLVDQLPALTQAVQDDVMPILTTLDRVAPDLRELLDVAKDVRKAIDGVPGSGLLRKRGEAVNDERDAQ